MVATVVNRTFLMEEGTDGEFVTCPRCLAPFKLSEDREIPWHVPERSPEQECLGTGTLMLLEPLSGDDLTMYAAELGCEVHAGDKDKSGDPYVDHLEGVAQGVIVFAGPFAYDAIAAAWLHDAIEDHPALVSAEKLLTWGFPQSMIDAVLAVTKKAGENQEDYLERIVMAGETAMYVKLADVQHNTRPDRMAAVAKSKGDSTRTRLLKKYTPAKARLMLELGIIQTTEGQELATKPVGTGGTTTWSSTDHANFYSGKALVAGDWPAGWPDRIKEKVKGHDNRYVLEDGSVRGANVTLQYKVWTRHSRKPGVDKDWTPAQEQEETKELKTTYTSQPVTKGSWKSETTKAGAPKKEEKPAETGLISLTPVPPDEEEPSLARGAPRSICGMCGLDTYMVSSTFWKHTYDSLVKMTHVASKPTKERVDTLITKGLAIRG